MYIHACVYFCVYAHICVYIYIYIYTRIHIHICICRTPETLARERRRERGPYHDD